MINLILVTTKNKEIAKILQENIFPKDKSPDQIDRGIAIGNPKNYIAYHGKKPVGIVGFYFKDDLPDHALLNWYGVIESERGQGFGRIILDLAIEEAKKLQPKRKYLTYYSDKKENAVAIELYKKMGFVTRDYCNQIDIDKIINKNIENNYVIGIFSLHNDILPKFEDVNLKISDELDELDKFN